MDSPTTASFQSTVNRLCRLHDDQHRLNASERPSVRASSQRET
ncbi:hypothetical protein RSSM_04633 [Rhodopirellula sallentina SM41]|uniref:Uncharacterized protein n=1 Tax=Rhodopirellula sallentina SM41 TaxID=1263870 RepID=M5U7N9_9BACT|nr:hypothetical protein RSSM_04633 [Rhodopirellula sallentina SM41]